MRLCRVAFLLLTLAPLARAQQAQEEAGEPDFRESRWGDLRSAVRRTERGQPTVPFPGTLEYRARVFDRDARVQYDFAGDLLKSAGYQFDTDSRGETDRLFDDIRELLVSKYGSPSSCRDIDNQAYRDSDDEQECSWEGRGRTRILLKTNHDPEILSEWHYVWVYYVAEDISSIITSGARRASPDLFGRGATADSTTALFGLRWGDSEAAVRRVFGTAIHTDDTGTGRQVLFRAPDVTELSGMVLATFFDGGLQMLAVRYESSYITRTEFNFFLAMMTFVLGEPTVAGVPTAPDADTDLVARWTEGRVGYTLAYDERAYGEDYLAILAQPIGVTDAERRDRIRHAGDF